jgi:drug/metabolite transporter (DMT)-like permease
MWIAFALVAAFASAGTSYALKLTVAHGGAVVSTVAFRLVSGVLLFALVAATGGWPELTPTFWRATAVVLVPEVLGMLFLTLALRAGELSVVQPLSGLLPPMVMAGGFFLLGEVPTRLAAAGVVLVTLGIYCIGLQPGGSALEPLRALARSRASWYAVAAMVAWSAATMVHKTGVREVGAFPWGATLAMGSAVLLAVALPLVAWKGSGGIGLPKASRPWSRLVLLTAVAFALQVAALQVAFGITQASYVVAVTSLSILIATTLGILFLGKRSAPRTRTAGALLVTTGAALIALFG